MAEIDLNDPRVQEVLDRFNATHPGVTLRVVDIPGEPEPATDGPRRAALFIAQQRLRRSVDSWEVTRTRAGMDDVHLIEGELRRLADNLTAPTEAIAERDAARRERDVLQAKLNIVRDALRAAERESDQMLPVIGAARAWRRERAGTPTKPKPEAAALIAAVDALPSAETSMEADRLAQAKEINHA